MANITAAAVKSLREKTGLPMMECKKALQENNGDEAQAIDWLRKHGKAKMETRASRDTEEGRIGIYVGKENAVAAMVEVLCESASVASHEEFEALVNDLAQQPATGPGAATAEELLAQNSPSKSCPLQDQFDDLNNRTREVFKLTRLERVEGTCAAYRHHTGTAAVLLQVEGDNDDLGKDICMHIVAMRPESLSPEDLDPTVVAKEREILIEAAKAEGKPDNIAEKIVEGRIKSFFSENCLTEQPFVKDDSKTVGQAAADGGLKLTKMIHWQLGR